MTSHPDQAPDASRRLVGRTTIGTAWIMVARIVVRLSDFMLLVVLTRLLAPEDFGLVAIATSIIAILDVITSLPIVTPVVRLDRVEKRHLDTAFTLGVLRGLVVIGATLLLAGPLAAAYGDPRLVPLLIVLSIATVVRGLESPGMARLFKALRYRQTFVIEVVGKAVGLVAAVVFGLLTGSYWALVVCPVVTRVVGVPISYFYAPYRPALGLSEFRYFWDFLGWIFPSQMIIAAGWQFDRLFLGVVVSPAVLGFYSVANSLSTVVEQSVRTSVTSPLISSFVIAGSDGERLRRGYVLADNAILMACIPAYLILFFFAEPLITLALGAKWLSAAPLLMGLSLAQIPALVRIPFRPLAMAAGRTDYIFAVALLSLSFRIPAVAGGWAVGGIMGVIVGIGLANLCNAAVAMYFIRRTIDMTVSHQLAASWRFFGAAIPASALAWLSAAAISGTGGLSLSVALAGCCAAVAGTYFASTFLLWYLAGRPDGIEARVLVQLRVLHNRTRKEGVQG